MRRENTLNLVGICCVILANHLRGFQAERIVILSRAVEHGIFCAFPRTKLVLISVQINFFLYHASTCYV